MASLESLFRYGSEKDQEINGAYYPEMMSGTARMLEPGEEVTHVCGFTDMSRFGMPNSLLAVTTRRVIIDGEKAIRLQDIQGVQGRKPGLIEAVLTRQRGGWTLFVSTGERQYKWSMQKDALEKMIAAIGEAFVKAVPERAAEWGTGA